MTTSNPEAQQRIHKPAMSKQIRFTETGIRNIKRIQSAELERTGRSISPSVAIEIALHNYRTN